MKPIQSGDLLDLTAYERARSDFRARIIKLKEPRRIGVGDRLTFVFENRDTVLFQIQEILRAERTVDEEAIQAELDIYNELIPKEHELSATLMIEIPEMPKIREELDRLIGIDECVYLEIGGERVQATFDPKQFESDRISAVQYVRFPLGAKRAARFADAAVPVRLTLEHPNYTASTPIEGASRLSLVGDL